MPAIATMVCAAALALVFAACDGDRATTTEIRDGEESSAISTTELAEPALPPDPPAIEGEPIAYRFAISAPPGPSRAAGEPADDDAEPDGYVATPTRDGYVLEAQREGGERRWRTEIGGARGDVRVQLRTSDRGLIVSVRAESGDLLDLVDARSGDVIGRTRFDA
ncbi:MAG: hypothetical protein M3Y87_03440, partial [Myxococcota bacterium]|nr:hypothetical protein [Myxococcota bacterium]